MNATRRAAEMDCQLLSKIAEKTFIESHGASASVVDIKSYVQKKYTAEIWREELNDSENIYFIISCYGLSAGYSKIIFNKYYRIAC